jgi:hypothetical protein
MAERDDVTPNEGSDGTTAAHRAVEDFFALLHALALDLVESERRLPEAADSDDHANYQSAFRVATRSLFALIEGITFMMKRLAYEVGRAHGVEFTRAEITALLEETSDVNEKGCATAKRFTIQLKNNVRFAFRMLSKVFKSDYQVDVSGADWDRFLNAVSIRNRLMHPKRLEDLTLSVDETQAVAETSRWFYGSLEGLLKRMGRAGK